MKSIAASTILLSPFVADAARVGLLRVDSLSFVPRSQASNAIEANRRVLVEEDFNLVFRQLFGYEDLSLSSASPNLSLSMANLASLSMHFSMNGGYDGVMGGTEGSSFFDDNEESDSSNDSAFGGGSLSENGVGQASQVPSASPNDASQQGPSSPEQSGSAAESDTVNTIENPSEEPNGGSTAKKAMIGILSVAGIAVVGAALARRMKKDSANNSSEPSVFDSHDSAGPV